MSFRSRFAIAIVYFLVASGCANYQPLPSIVGGFMSPLVARTSCIDAVSREFKASRENVKPISDSMSMEQGFYVVSLSIGAGQPAINCTVNENGVVSDVIRAR